MAIGTLVKSIQDIMRKDVGVDGDAQRISQIVWLLFLKIFDDREQEWELTVKDYKSPLSKEFRWSYWAKDSEGMTGDELIDFVNNRLFPVLKNLATVSGVSDHGRVVGAVFEDAYNYMKSGTLLRQVINSIESNVDFNSSTDRHLFNDIYEKILADLQSAGNAGEYYTPRAVTQFMVDILDPKLGEKILDPACGTGGFLTNVIEYLKPQLKTPDDRKTLESNITGIEKKPLPHMLAMTNVMLHGIDVPSNIRHDNTLSRPLRDYGSRDRVDMIITNPPFGGMEEDGIESNFPKKYQTRETADLFMGLIMNLLKPGGRSAVVLPDGFLFGEGVKTTLKRELLEEFNLHTIVRLPKGVFSPYTSINTNILFFEKGGPTKEVWFFEHPYPVGYKSYSRSKPLTIGEFDREKKWWGKRKKSEYAWKISAKEIAARNYNLDCKNPYEVEVNHRDPDELMVEYLAIDREMKSVQDSLKQELMDALRRCSTSDLGSSSGGL
jgi:type I restriction enzyme M protein